MNTKQKKKKKKYNKKIKLKKGKIYNIQKL